MPRKMRKSQLSRGGDSPGGGSPRKKSGAWQPTNQAINQQQTAILCAFDHLRFGLFGKLRQKTSLLCCFVCGWDSRHRRGFPVQC
jgi:hypothetical protein